VGGQRLRTLAGLWMVAELVVYVLVAQWIGIGWTILATLATSALGLALLGSQGTRALRDLQDRARTRQHPERALGDAGLVAVGGLLMLLPGFLGDVVGLLCLLPGTRVLPRLLLGRAVAGRLPDRMRGPVHVRSTRAGQVGPDPTSTAPGPPRVIEGEVIEGEVIEGEVIECDVVPGPGTSD
jgi:UPF0716 protein FxsA